VRQLRSLPRARRRLEVHGSRWYARKATDITREDIARLHQSIAEKSGRVIANRVITLLRVIYNHALDHGIFKRENPAARIKFFREEPRTRFLSPEEFARINTALAQEPNQYWRAYFALLLLLGTRRSELLAAKWSDIDLNARTIVFPTTKTGSVHRLPLPEAAISILMSLPSREASRHPSYDGKTAARVDWVFPGQGVTGHLQEPRACWLRICARAEVHGVTIHDLRRTLGSWMAAQGASLPIIGRALGHKSQTSTQIYARLDLAPIRAALEKNAALMLGATAATTKETRRG
jgi:integrase